ncbi:MAG: PE family protein [Candidatus Obscuribacterales bacterium]|nr:PE family protein [Candidatus Obscuribacterales bacterium]
MSVDSTGKDAGKKLKIRKTLGKNKELNSTQTMKKPVGGSFVVTAPEVLQSAAGELGGIGSVINSGAGAAANTPTSILPAVNPASAGQPND